MPVAIGTAAPGDDAAQAYVQLGRELASLVYWWTPDVSFLRENASPIVLPPFNPAEHARKIYRTGREELTLTKWAAADMDVVAHRAFSLAGAIALSKQDVASVLLKHLELKELSGDTTHWDTACTWLKQASTASTWQAWIPSDTTCPLGRGLVDSQRNYVTHRDLAVACAACPAGMFSQESEDTRICTKCPAGTHQRLSGEAFCEACQPGTFSMEEGRAECAPCGLGQYANSSGMKACFQCGASVTLDNKKLHLFTTSQLVMSSTSERIWIPVQGASSEDFCSCVSGAHRTSSGLCERCPEGPWLDRMLAVRRSYFSQEDDPGYVFECLERSHCPGGVPGTCAEGRDPASVACSSCLPGLHSAGTKCIPCEGGDYVLVSSLLVLFMLIMTGGYLLFSWGDSKGVRSSSFIVVSCGLGQLAMSIQVISVIHQFRLDWGEPIASLLALTEILAVELNIFSFDCLTPSDPVPLFLFHVMVLPCVLVALSCIHFCTVLAKRSSSTWQFHRLGQAVGSLCVVFFISFCSSLLPPLICQTHPNQLSTLRAYPSVACNGGEEHLAMILITAFSFLLPASFLASSVWLVVQLPSRIYQSDLKFIRAASFLFGRFRPGAETMAVWLLLRNALLVLLPLASKSASTFVMNILLSLTLAACCFYKPWRMKACTYLDMFLLACMIFIVTLGSHVAGQVSETLTVVACLTLMTLMFVALLVFILYGFFTCCRGKQKAFRFFLSHHKSRAGCVARWLKMLLLQRGKTFTSFAACLNLGMSSS
ncbi:40S ribosomal protein S6 [Durusdinium trenchii]|uniref:40S ribosomal protein S6 n=1 Tax=Durusdinium trenchii TaxID=1381693 RepID=A0ABP0QSC9_9DINO